MTLPLFKTNSASFASSIALDASTVGGTTVTVAVHSTREQEPEILSSIYEHGADIGFKPFYDKANNYEHTELQGFCENLIHANRAHLEAFAHSRARDKNTNLQQVEAVHSAIHVNDLLVLGLTPLVIIDGNEQKAKPFLEALSGLTDDHPTTAHGQKSEFYYPNALLADLTANYLAHTLEQQYDYMNPVFPVVHAKQARSDEWGQAFNGMYQNSVEYTPAQLPGHRGDSVRQRICCWYKGAVFADQGSQPPISDSLNPVVRTLERDGFDNLGSILRGL
ncbi:hypothetical protein ACFQH3_19265 [Haladaptatus sp. GCM10025707]|uniref:hypothetical protein n=1 Tax=unclassified Haladaptatus TaxID=2622732 RepID=UPI0023E7EFE8|nr:hypothetical protein [Haladaptatus sp. QDMS2]